MGPHVAAAVAATAASLAPTPAAEAIPSPEHAAITASHDSHEVRSNIQEALTPPPLEEPQATTKPLELSSYGWTNFFDPQESPQFLTHLKDIAPGVTFELGETRAGLTNGHLVLRGGGLQNDTSVKLDTLRAGDSLAVRKAPEIVPGASATTVLRIERLEGPAIEVDQGAVALDGTGFKVGFSAARDRSDPPELPITLTPHDQTAVIHLSHEALVVESPTATEEAPRPERDSDTIRVEVGISFDQAPLKSQTIITTEGSPNGVSVDGLAAGISASIGDRGGVVTAGRSRYDSPSDLLLDNATAEIAVGPGNGVRCTVCPTSDTPVAIALARNTTALEGTLAIDRVRSVLPSTSVVSGTTAISDTGVVLRSDKTSSFDPNAAAFRYEYRDRVVVDCDSGAFALSPGLRDTPVTVTRTASGTAPAIEVVSNGELHGVFTADSMLLSPPSTEATRAGEVLGTVKVSGRGSAGSHSVDITLDQNGSLESFGARAVQFDEKLSPQISGWGSHWGTPAASLHDRGLRPGILDHVGYREAVEQATNKIVPQILAEVQQTLESGIPERFDLDTTTGSFTATGFGPDNEGSLSFTRAGDSGSFRAQNLAGPVFDQIAQTAWTLGGDARTASNVLAHGNDLASPDGKTASALTGAGLSDPQVELLKTELGEILARPEMREALNSIPFDFDLDTRSILVKEVALDYETDADGLRSFRGSLSLQGLRVNGALPLGEVGNVAGAIVGAPGVLHDLGEGLEKATDNNPLVAPITIPAKIVGGIFKGGELATKVAAGNVDVSVNLRIQGYEKLSGEWVVTKDPVQLVAK